MNQAYNKCGFVAVVGRPNAGKSTFLNWLVGQKLALVSHKANATRKRMNLIVMHKEAQIIFVDTPGIHQKERLLNRFMMDETLKAFSDADLILFLAPVTDSIKHYKDFLERKVKIPHILVLTKIDTISKDELLKKMAQYTPFSDSFEALIPVSVKKDIGKDELLDEVIKFLPLSPYLFDVDDLTTSNYKEIYKEFIREAIFQNTSDEIPYSSDVIIEKINEKKDIEEIFAKIVVEKESQKGIVIGKDGTCLKRIGMSARYKIEQLINKKVVLKLLVVVDKNWTKNKEKLKKLGFTLED